MAVDYVTFDDICENLTYQCSEYAVLSDLITLINAYRVTNAVPLAVELSETNINDMLRLLTGCTVATGTELNCYPRGLVTTMLFDADGNEIP